MDKSFSYQKVRIEILSPTPELLLREMLYLALYVPAGQKAFPRAILDRPEIAKYYKNFGSRKLDVSIVAKIADQQLGLIWGRSLPANNPGYGFVAEDIPEIGMSVLSEFRNRAIGSSLLKEITELYSEMGVRAISLSVDHRNPARKLYDRFGFEIHSRHGSSWTMIKYLTGS